MNRYPSASVTSTLDVSTSSDLLSLVQDGDTWIVNHHGSAVFGHGRSLLEAFADFWAALHSHLAVTEGEAVTPRIAAQNERVRWLLGLAEE